MSKNTVYIYSTGILIISNDLKIAQKLALYTSLGFVVLGTCVTIVEYKVSNEKVTESLY